MDALASAKEALGVPKDAPWDAPFYQYANRLAHLYFLRQLNGLDATLLFLYFAQSGASTTVTRKSPPDALTAAAQESVLNGSLQLTAA